MKRREFLIRAGGVTLTACVAPGVARSAIAASERVGMGTVIFRNRFVQTKPKTVTEIRDPLTLRGVPAYYRERFGIRQLEFWSHHFESLEGSYLAELRSRLQAAGAELINVQVDGDYDLASADEEKRQRSLATVRQWIDAAASLRSRAVRVNPGKPDGSVEKSIASMKEVNQLCQAKGLPLLTENHFGIEMDPAIHLRIRAEAGPANIHTLPDFGNYPVDSMWESLAKILPHAYLISAKAVDFDTQGKHLSYDFDRCVQLCERSGFKGIYLVEQWSRKDQQLDADKIADWLLARVRANI